MRARLLELGLELRDARRTDGGHRLGRDRWRRTPLLHGRRWRRAAVGIRLAEDSPVGVVRADHLSRVEDDVPPARERAGAEAHDGGDHDEPHGRLATAGTVGVPSCG